MIRAIAVIIATFASLGLMTAPAEAAFNPENKLYVYGRVLPTHYVVINAQGNILQIISNTTEDVTPRVYIERITKETEVPLTDEINQAYQKEVPKGSSKVGILYENKPQSEPQAVVRTAGYLLIKVNTALF
jgi:sugar (pentulose or hexulose) kinase